MLLPLERLLELLLLFFLFLLLRCLREWLRLFLPFLPDLDLELEQDDSESEFESSGKITGVRLHSGSFTSQGGSS